MPTSPGDEIVAVRPACFFDPLRSNERAKSTRQPERSWRVARRDRRARCFAATLATHVEHADTMGNSRAIDRECSRDSSTGTPHGTEGSNYAGAMS